MTQSANDQVVVATRELTKIYGEFVALDALSIELRRGHILGFIGPNGAGKTTTIKILVGLAKPTSGQASICGVDCAREAHRIKTLVGYMPDTFGSYENMRVREYLDFFGAAFKIPRDRRLKRIEEVMEITGATYMKDRYCESLSHGMKQRVAIARTLLHDPEVMILDEPANGLDPQARIDMREILLRLATMGKTLIVTSHILPELARICDTVAIITGGKLRAFGTLEHIMRDMRQRRIIEVQLLRGEALEAAARIVEAHLDAEAQVTRDETELMVRFVSQASDELLARILAALVKAEIPLCQFRELHQDLEDAFLSVTRQSDGKAQNISPEKPAAAAVKGGK